MTPHVRLALVIHNHQPVGNFDHVVERAYQTAYRPLLDAFARVAGMKFTLHLSGPLFDWLEERHPDFLDETAKLVRQGRVQILGGAYYEPILPMIPRRDRIGQISRFSERLARRFGEVSRGLWLPERVWEQQLASDLAAAGIQHTIVDDAHFQQAGVPVERLHGYYLTEDEGRLLAVLPGNERLRYMLPFSSPEEAVEYLRGVATENPGATVVFADDGEKFGAWPGTYEHCHDHGWLQRFCDLLAANTWIETTLPEEIVRDVAPLGKVYLPDGSYREMNEWASIDKNASGGWLATAGNWRNFLVKYPEAGEMYARMQMVSDRVARAVELNYPPEITTAAQDELYKAQCNCAYWHGSFAGVYLSHLRHAVYRHLIRADNILDRTADRPAEWVEAVVRDHNLDVRPEVCLGGDRLIAFLAPHDGGRLYELDARAGARNVLATAARRPEPYHTTADATTYDTRPRKCLVEHFYAVRPRLDDVASGRAVDVGDFADGAYTFRVERRADAAAVRMRRIGRIGDHPLVVTKTVTLAAGGDTLLCDYELENLPADRTVHFGVEFNFAGFDDGDGRTLEQASGRTLGRLGRPLELPALDDVRLVDVAGGAAVGVKSSKPASWFIYPVRVDNRCESGMESTHQATCIVPSWQVRGDAEGRWSVTLSVPVETRSSAYAGHPDLGEREAVLVFPQAEIVTHTETVRGKPEVRHKTTRRLKAAG